MGARGRPSSTSLSRDKSTGSPEECSEGRGLVLPASLATLGRLCSRRRRLFRAARVRRQPHAVGQTRARSRPRGCGAAAPPFPARLPALGSSLHPAGPSESSSLREPVSLDPLTGYPAASAFCDVRGRPRAGGCSPPAARPPSARTGCAALRGRGHLQALLVVPARGRSHSGANAAFQDAGLDADCVGDAGRTTRPF